jgi:hypothetical protein
MPFPYRTTPTPSPASPRSALPDAGVVLASIGRAFSDAAIEQAASLASQSRSRVRVVTVARIHGSAFGLQHPGLMPNKKEKDAAQQVVTDAIKALQRKGLSADGEVVITRSPGRSFARVARAARAVTHVIVDGGNRGWLGRMEVGASAGVVRYRVKGVGVVVV